MNKYSYSYKPEPEKKTHQDWLVLLLVGAGVAMVIASGLALYFQQVEVSALYEVLRK